MRAFIAKTVVYLFEYEYFKAYTLLRVHKYYDGA